MKSSTLFFLILFIFTSSVFAEEGDIKFSSNSLIFFTDKNMVILDDNVVVSVNKLEIRGDSLIFYSDSNIAKAYENVNIKSKHQNVDCDSVYYNIKSKKGVIFGGISHVPQGLFRGEIVTQDSNRVLKIYNAKFTTCDRVPPHYYFYSSKIKMYEDNYALVKPLIVYVHDIPVFFAPFWFFPVREERHSGFLVPNIGASPNEGKFVKNISFFWAMNPFMDATFTVNIRELRGIEGIINYEYLLKPILKGNVNFSYINEFSGNTRWKIDMEHTQTLFGNGNLILNGDFYSDNNVVQDYNDTTLVILDKEIYSYLSFTKRLWKINTNFVMENRRNLATNEFNNKFPSVSISFPSYNLFPFQNTWYKGTYFSFGNNFENSYDTLSHKVRNNTNVSFSSNFKLLRYVNLNHNLGSNYSYVRDTISSQNVLLHNSVGLYTNIYGFTKRPFFNVKTIRHTITPSFNLAYYNSYINGDTAYLGPVGIGLKNTFEAKLNNGSVVRLLNLNFSSSYSFTNKLFSDINMDAQTNLTKGVSFRVNTKLNPYSMSFSSYSLTLNGEIDFPFFDDSMHVSAIYNIGNSFQTTGAYTNAIDFHVTGKITDGWSIDYSGRVDLNARNVVNQQISLIRDLHCWELSINYQTFATDYRIDANLHIKKLPNVQLGKGLFDIFGL